MLKPGGMLLYSTCTFDPAEDEEVVDYMLEICPSLRIVPTPQIDGFVHGFSQFAQHDPEGIRNTVRLFPHRIRGDGHFAALLQKEGTRSDTEDLREVANRKGELKELMYNAARCHDIGKILIANIINTQIRRLSDISAQAFCSEKSRTAV